MRSNRKYLKSLILGSFLVGCAPVQNKNEIRTYPVELRLSADSNISAKGELFNLFLPKAQAEVQSLKLCFKRLRFKTLEAYDDSSSSSSDDSHSSYAVADDQSSDDNGTDDNGTDDNSEGVHQFEDSIDFKLGEVDLSSGVSSLGRIDLPEGDYRRIEFDLESKCGHESSVQVFNQNGLFKTSDRITIKFDGSFSAKDLSVLTISVDSILKAAEQISTDSEIKKTLLQTSGSIKAQ